MSDSKLDFVTTEELVMELHRRHCCSVIILLQDRTSTEETYLAFWDGGLYTSMGLAQRFLHDRAHGTHSDAEDGDFLP